MVRLCHIGCGEQARVAHGPSQRRCASERKDLVLAGCCDLDPARAESFRREFGYSLYVHVPMWGGADSPGRLSHFAEGRLAEEITGDRPGCASRGSPWRSP